MGLDLDVAILSVFCAGGLFAYVREALRLRRLISSGEAAVARIVSTGSDNAGSESITHYIVKYEFIDADGYTRVHENDLNSKRFFDALKQGDTIDVLYEPAPSGNSYPVSQVNLDMKISGLIAVGIFVFWAAMATFFALT
jgi:hypothetical protein